MTRKLIEKKRVDEKERLMAEAAGAQARDGRIVGTKTRQDGSRGGDGDVGNSGSDKGEMQEFLRKGEG